MSKRNIAYIKPQDPSFLAKLKAQIGYTEGPTVETKKQRLEQEDYSDAESVGEREDEKPQVVVLKTGDLTAEEVALEEARLVKEAAEAPADLSQRIVFKKRPPVAAKSGSTTADDAVAPAKRSTNTALKKSSEKSTRKAAAASSKLSFTQDDEDDDNDADEGAV